jgi:tetratricopeptide (TPR) repeat protein
MEAALTPTLTSGVVDKSRLRKIGALLQRTWVRCAILALLGFAVHFPSLQGQLIWDDQYLAHDNAFIKSPLLILESFRHYLFLDSFSAHYRPVQNISYIFDYLIWNTDPYGFHLSNVLWHVGSGILLYLLLARLLKSFVGDNTVADRRSFVSIAAFFAALLWVVHPVHSAAVDYISGRADSLAFFFASGSWLLYLRARDTTRPIIRYFLYFLAAAFLLLALCSRESACLWVAMFLGHLFIFEKETGRRAKFAALMACLLVVSSYAALRQLPDKRTTTIASSTGWPAPVRATLMARALGDYGRLMIWPSNLHMERTVFDADSLQNSAGWRKAVSVEYLSIAGLIIASGLIIAAAGKGPARGIRIFGAAWFLVAYLPTSNLFELNATVAEHWLYLPSVGFLIFAAGCLLELSNRSRRVAVAFACLACLGLSARSFIRSADWVTAETFYQRTLAAGGKTLRVAMNLGQVYSSKGEYAKAEALFRRVLEISPDYTIARSNLGEALFRQGKTKEAEAVFAVASKSADQSRKDYPRTWIATLNLAHMRHNEQDDEAALAIMAKARADYPGIWELVSFEAELLRQVRGADSALPLIREFTGNHWWHSGAFMALGRLLAEQGDAEEADAALRHASWLDIHDAESLNLIAAMKVRQNHLDAACATQRRAVARQPDQPRQYLLLSDILEKMGRHDEAQAALAQVQVLQALAKSQTSKVVVN